MDRNEVEQQLPSKGRVVKWVFWTSALFLTITIAVYIIGVVLLPMRVASKVADPDRIIYTYEWFFQQHADIQSYGDQIDAAEDAVTLFKEDRPAGISGYYDSQELSRLRSVSQGLKNQQASAVRDYNAKAQNRTRAIFRDWSLPAHLCVTQNYQAVEC